MISKKHARKLFDRLAKNWTATRADIQEIIEAEAWKALGFDTLAEAWEALVGDITLPAEVRPLVVYQLLDEGREHRRRSGPGRRGRSRARRVAGRPAQGRGAPGAGLDVGGAPPLPAQAVRARHDPRQGRCREPAGLHPAGQRGQRVRRGDRAEGHHARASPGSPSASKPAPPMAAQRCKRCAAGIAHDFAHGRGNGYSYHGCRCGVCKAWKLAADREVPRRAPLSRPRIQARLPRGQPREDP